MAENKNDRPQDEALPEAASMKKLNKKMSGFTWIIIAVGILNILLMQTKYSLIFSALFVVLGIIYVIGLFKNRVKK